MGSGDGGGGATTPWWARLDPEGRAWRNATRGVVMAVPLFAVYAALDLVVWAPWAFIGLLNTLLPDIGGPVRPRLRTSVEILLGSVVAAFLGALVADQPVALVAAMFVVAFAAAYVGVLSPYLAAAGTSVLLVFLLSGGSPTDEVSVAGWRALNVAVGAVLAVAAIMALVPAPRRRRVEPALAGACGALADLLEPPAAGPVAADGREDAARAAVAAMVTATTTQRWPPLSSSRVDRARLAFTHDLQSLFSRAVAIHRSDAAGHRLPEADAARRTAAGGLRALGSWLLDAGSGPDGSALRAAAEQTAALELAQRDAAAGAVGDADAFERFRVARRTASACHLVATVADGVSAAAFHTEQGAPAAREGLVDVTRSEPGYWRRLVVNLSPTSMTFRHAVRLATACAIASAAEQALHLVHGYWAVLTVVVTLRTSRGASASRSVERLMGTVGGVVVASVSIVVADLTPHRTAVIMALTVAWLAPTLWAGAARLRWAWGVIAITACILTMFQLETPGDWSLEAERIVATVVGLTVALGSAMVLWPGSSAVALRRAVGGAASALAGLVIAVRDAGRAEHGAATALAAARVEADRRVIQARSTLGAACREGAVDEGSGLTVAVLELEQAAELVRRVDDALTGTFRTAPTPAAGALVDAAAGTAAEDLQLAARRFADPTPDAVSDDDDDDGDDHGDDAVPPLEPPPSVAAPRPGRRTDDAADRAWRALPPGSEVTPQVLDAVADLGTLGHRGEDMAALATGPTTPP